jgi:hypothetical protein
MPVYFRIGHFSGLSIILENLVDTYFLPFRDLITLKKYVQIKEILEKKIILEPFYIQRHSEQYKKKIILYSIILYSSIA